MFLISSLFFFVWFLCGRLSWLLVSFWAHVNIVHHIISYHIGEASASSPSNCAVYTRKSIKLNQLYHGYYHSVFIKYYCFPALVLTSLTTDIFDRLRTTVSSAGSRYRLRLTDIADYVSRTTTKFGERGFCYSDPVFRLNYVISLTF